MFISVLSFLLPAICVVQYLAFYNRILIESTYYYPMLEFSPILVRNVSTTCDRSLGINNRKTHFSFLCSGRGAEAGEEDDESFPIHMSCW